MTERTGAKPMVIVGGGKAGGTAAATLRDEGFGGRVVIISQEPGIPFGRPPLSKTYLRSEEDLKDWYVRPADWYEAHDVELLTDTGVTAIDAAAHMLVLDSGLELVLGEQVGALIGAIHRSSGVRLLAGAQVAAYEGTERLEAVVTAAGDRVSCDFAVVGVGIDPDVPAVAGSSVAQENGILVDELCRTSAADIYADGDVANHLHPVLGRVRVEHYNSADHQGAAPARSMLGSAAPFDYIHNFWSDQYEHTLQYVGHATNWDDFAVRGSLQEGKLVGFYLLGGVA